jgi:hypothetical protein
MSHPFQPYQGPPHAGQMPPNSRDHQQPHYQDPGQPSFGGPPGDHPASQHTMPPSPNTAAAQAHANVHRRKLYPDEAMTAYDQTAGYGGFQPPPPQQFVQQPQAPAPGMHAPQYQMAYDPGMMNAQQPGVQHAPQYPQQPPQAGMAGMAQQFGQMNLAQVRDACDVLNHIGTPNEHGFLAGTARSGRFDGTSTSRRARAQCMKRYCGVMCIR